MAYGLCLWPPTVIPVFGCMSASMLALRLGRGRGLGRASNRSLGSIRVHYTDCVINDSRLGTSFRI